MTRRKGIPMGFLSKLKNNLTGGWADVEVTATPTHPGGTTTVAAIITVKDQPITISGVHLEIQRQDMQSFDDASGQAENRWVTQHHDRTTVSGPAEVSAGTRGTFTHVFGIPPDSRTSSRWAVKWRARAVVEMDGNDPDSGWQEFNVS